MIHATRADHEWTPEGVPHYDADGMVMQAVRCACGLQSCDYYTWSGPTLDEGWPITEEDDQ